MSVNNITLKEGATAIAVTGGTNVVFTPDGEEVKNGVHVQDAAEFDVRIRRSMTMVNKKAALQPDGDFSKSRRKVTKIFPKVLASGKTVYPLVRYEIESHPEQTEAEVDDMLFISAQIPRSADLLPFFKTGNLS
jgi:hypothetical protein